MRQTVKLLISQGRLPCSLIIVMLIGYGCNQDQVSVPDSGISYDLMANDLSNIPCPDSTAIHAAKCNTTNTLFCEGGSQAKTCDFQSAGALTCKCKASTWLCVNWACADYCPSTYLEAKKGPSCIPKQTGISASCRYSTPIAICHCSSGKIVCNP